MTAVWVTLAIVAVAAFFPLALEARYSEKGFTVFLKTGPVWLTLYPKKEKKSSAPPPKKKAAKHHGAKSGDTKKGGALPPVRELFPLLRPTLAAVKKRVTLHVCRVWVTVGGQGDPAGAALAYGGIHAFFGVFSAALLDSFKVKESDFRCGMDFDAPETAILLELGASLRLWQLCAIVLPLLARFMKRYREKESRLQQTRNEVNRHE